MKTFYYAYRSLYIRTMNLPTISRPSRSIIFHAKSVRSVNNNKIPVSISSTVNSYLQQMDNIIKTPVVLETVEKLE